MRLGITLMGVLAASLCMAGTIRVTSPTVNSFLSRNNSVSFVVTGASAQVTVSATATSVTDPNVRITVSNRFTPTGDPNINGSLNLNFAQGILQGPYTLELTATEPGNTYNTPSPISVTVDTLDPKFIDFNPVSGGFVRTSVPITARFDEANLKEWRVKVNGADFSNNTGTTNDLLAVWDTSGITADGQNNIEIRAEDQAGNVAIRTISVTLDRNPPIVQVVSPISGQIYRPGSNIPVVVQIRDQFSDAVSPSGIRVEVRDLANNLLGIVARSGAQSNGTNVTWSGRLRHNRSFPSAFRIVVTAVDKAGNAATIQTVMVSNNRSVVVQR